MLETPPVCNETALGRHSVCLPYQRVAVTGWLSAGLMSVPPVNHPTVFWPQPKFWRMPIVVTRRVRPSVRCFLEL